MAVVDEEGCGAGHCQILDRWRHISLHVSIEMNVARRPTDPPLPLDYSHPPPGNNTLYD